MLINFILGTLAITSVVIGIVLLIAILTWICTSTMIIAKILEFIIVTIMTLLIGIIIIIGIFLFIVNTYELGKDIRHNLKKFFKK